MGNKILKRAEKRSKQLAREIQKTEKAIDKLRAGSIKFKEKRRKELKKYSDDLFKCGVYSLDEITQMFFDAEKMAREERFQNFTQPLWKHQAYLDETKQDKEICDYYIQHHKEKDE